MITVYSNKDEYTNNNVRVGQDGYVSEYVKGAKNTNLQGVEIGFAFLSKSIIGLLPDENVSFEATVYPRLAAQHQMLA